MISQVPHMNRKKLVHLQIDGVDWWNEQTNETLKLSRKGKYPSVDIKSSSEFVIQQPSHQFEWKKI